MKQSKLLNLVKVIGIKNQAPSKNNISNTRSGSSFGNVNTMVFNQEDATNEDLFGMKLVEWCEHLVSNEDYGCFELEENILRSLNERDVFTYLTYRCLSLT